MSVTNALGYGQRKGCVESYRGVDDEVTLLKKVRIEIVVNEDFVERCIESLCDGARTGQIGDGKILVLDLSQCIRIRTRKGGGGALG